MAGRELARDVVHDGLGEAVDVLGRGLLVLAHRALGVAVDGGGRGVDHALGAGLQRELQHVAEGVHVHFHHLALVGFRGVHYRRLVQHGVHLARPVEPAPRADIVGDDVAAEAHQVLVAAGRKIIEHGHFGLAFPFQGEGDVGAYEAGAAGHEIFFHISLRTSS